VVLLAVLTAVVGYMLFTGANRGISADQFHRGGSRHGR
jgi:hypothetical protein